MFFVLAKVLGFFALPSNVFVALGLVGLLLQATRFARIGLKLVIASLVLLALFGWTPLGNILMLPLEQRFPAWQGGGREPDGIVVLGGVFDTLVFTRWREAPPQSDLEIRKSDRGSFRTLRSLPFKRQARSSITAG